MPAAAKQAKLDRIAGLLKPEYRTRRQAGHFDCLDDETRRSAGIVPTSHVSENPYHVPALQLFERHRDGLVLDVGAGRRDGYLPHVVYLEVVPYESTDVLAAGETLPFVDGAFDAVHSCAVLEHVRDPFACAREVMRVLKPGGELMCSVPFLQPYHGFPRHYYNMTHQGLHNLFAGLDVFGVEVYEELRPYTALQWMAGSWAMGLPPEERDRFLDTTLRELLAMKPDEAFAHPFVAGLPPAKNHELACASTLFARKPGEREALAILSATYGAGDRVADVSRVLAPAQEKGALFLSCDVDLARLFGDPAPGLGKALTVAWRRGSLEGTVTVEEYGGRLRTPLWL